VTNRQTDHQRDHQLIRQVWVLDAVSQTDQVRDVLVSQGRIAAIAPTMADPPPDTEVIDGTGKVLIPGLVDLYSHSGEPGYESRETLESLLRAGQAGGFTRLGLLPTTEPSVDSPAMVEKLLAMRGALAAQNETPLPHLFPWGCLTRGANGEQMADLADLAAAGIVGFADGEPLHHPLLVQRLLQYLKPMDQPIALWSCDRSLRNDGIAREGPFALVYGLMGDPATSETAALAGLLECVALTGTPVHLMRLSTARGVTLVEQAKADGLPITASTSWMHLLFSTQDLSHYDPNLRLAPPLGNPEDQAALVAAVKSGVVDAIAVDHTPHTYEDKTVGFPSAPPGAIGLELAWPILWQRLVVQGNWSPLTLIQALSTHPATCWGQSPPTIQANHPAEMALFDPAVSWQVNPETLNSLSANTPWLGQTLQGKVLKTWVPHG
jgi:dihydroorotase